MTYKRDGASGYEWVENTETGHKVRAGAQVTIGKGKSIWDVTSVLNDGWGAKVELHRQIPSMAPFKRSNVMWRYIEMDRLTQITPFDETVWTTDKGWLLKRKVKPKW